MSVCIPVCLSVRLSDTADLYKNVYHGEFRIAEYEFRVEITKLKMADPILRPQILKPLENWSISMKLCTRAVFGFLNTNLGSTLQNSKWPIQYGYPNCENLQNLTDFYKTLFQKGFWVAECEFEFKIVKFEKSRSKMATRNLENLQKLTDFYETLYQEGFWVTEYDFSI